MLSSPIRITFVTGILLGLAISFLEFVKFYAELLEYEPFHKIASIVLIILIVYVLYWGIKEIRDRFYEGNIKFSKAFFYGVGISFVSFTFVFLYLILHYKYIDVAGLQKINERNAAFPPLMNVTMASLFFSFSVFLYGIFLNLFVSMYVYRRK